ncbi:MAG TPA: sigma-70 family RNA polymerase sigma factor [Blastocatellia bacterium]|jgi:RNA polymerase sigma factor (sigma-70 family)|nr:sigma-70 family RNA polymerase sigma factor [Blastocatellia bacterium]
MTNLASKEIAEDLGGRSDPELIAACLDGNHQAWETLLARYQRLIYSIPLKSRLSLDDAADIFQSVCLKLYEKLDTLRNHERISSWLITTTTRESWRVSARQRREQYSVSSDEDDSPGPLGEIAAPGPLADEEREALERQQIIREGVEALPGRCRELITMLFYHKDEMSYAEIARRMNMPVPSVGPTRARCLEKLKKLLQDKV